MMTEKGEGILKREKEDYEGRKKNWEKRGRGQGKKGL